MADYQWTPFDDILPKESTAFKPVDVPPLNPEQLDEAHHCSSKRSMTASEAIRIAGCLQAINSLFSV